MFVKCSENPTTYRLRSSEDIYGMSYDEAYAENGRLGRLIEEKDKWAMRSIMENVKSFWI